LQGTGGHLDGTGGHCPEPYTADLWPSPPAHRASVIRTALVIAMSSMGGGVVNRIDVSIEPEQTVPPQGMALPTPSRERRLLACAAAPLWADHRVRPTGPASVNRVPTRNRGLVARWPWGVAAENEDPNPAKRSALAPLPGVAKPIHRQRYAWR
jgi:hypothetical protein